MKKILFTLCAASLFTSLSLYAQESSSPATETAATQSAASDSETAQTPVTDLPVWGTQKKDGTSPEGAGSESPAEEAPVAQSEANPAGNSTESTEAKPLPEKIAAPEPPAQESEKKPEVQEFEPVSLDTGEEIVMKNGEIGETRIPPKKKPKTPDPEKIRELDNTDTENSREKNYDTLKFGLENELSELLDTLTKNEDVRFVDEAYTLFEETKSTLVREKALAYFAKIEDPCLENYAVTILDDPYEEKGSTVDACFSYVRALKTKEAIEPVLTLLENEDEKYFNNALDTIGEIGGPKEAKYLSDYLDREDLTVAQRQSLVRVLGKIQAVETYDKLTELAKDSDENSFVRMYAAESIGSMDNEDAIPILMDLYEDSDPNIRTYVIKGLANFKDNKDAEKMLIQGTRDSYYKVRLEAIKALAENGVGESVPYLIYRAKNDPEKVVKEACYPAIAKLDTQDGNAYLVDQITDKKVADNPKSKIATALLKENHVGSEQIIELARETLKDDRRKSLRYALGKEFAKYGRPEYSDICAEYIANKDVSTIGTGLDIYAKGRYSSVTPAVQALADKWDPDAKTRNAMAQKAAKILGISDEEAQKKIEKAKEAEKKTETASSASSAVKPESSTSTSDAK